MKRKMLLFYGVLVFCLMFTFSVQAKVLPANVVGLWLFDKDGDLSDASGNGHTGKADGNVKWTANGKFGMAIDLDGNSFVVIDHKADMNLQTFTIMGWVNLPTLPADWWTIACKDGWPDRNYGLWLSSGGGLAHCSFASGAGPVNNAANAVTAVNPKEWRHVTGSYDMKNINIYIDAVPDATFATTEKPNVTTEPFIIGRTPTATYKITGMIDEVALFNTALSEADIKAIFTSGLKATAAAIDSKSKLATTWSNVKSN
jgi:hypothetical protein